MRSRVLVVPAASDLDSFGRLVAQLAHDLGYANPERIVIPVDSSVLPEARAWLEAPSLAPVFGDRVAQRIEALRGSIALPSWPSDLEAVVLTSDVVVDWDTERSAAEPWAAIMGRYRADKARFILDLRERRPRPTGLAELGRVLAQGRAFDHTQAAAVAALGERFGRAAHAYLLGTGASTRTALHRDLSDGIRIICNTVILDDELMEHVRPHIMALADPLFFGPSVSAQRYQRAVVDQASRHDFAIVTTEQFAPLLRAHNPEIAERVIGLRRGRATWPDNFDLVTHPAVRPDADVLASMLLPLAATFAPSIGLIGFDRRDTGDRVYLELDDAEDRADGDAGRVAAIERLFVRLDERGIQVRSMAESDVPALRRRAMAPLVESADWASESRPILVSLAPDWIGDAGHHGPFERRVHEAAEATGHAHIALASAGLQPAADWQVPTFSEPTYPSGGGFAPVGRQFEDELRAGLAHLPLRPGTVAYLYAGDVWHVAAILAVAADHPDVRFVVNLMRAHGWLGRAPGDPDPWLTDLVDLLRDCLIAAARSNVEVTVDSAALARDVELLTGQAVPVWPMIAVSGIVPRRKDGHRAAGAPHVVAPVQAQDGRGFADLVALAERLREQLERGDLRLTTRWPDGANPAMVLLGERFEQLGGELFRGNFSDEVFAEFVDSADVVLVPYRLRPFRTRTSAVTIDALLAGKPAVAVRGTWAGELIERYGAGLTYAEGDAAEMDTALFRVIADLPLYRAKLAEIGTGAHREFDPARLVEFLRGGQSDSTAGVNAPPLAQDLRDRTDRLRRAHEWRVIAETSTRMAAAIREDDQQRSYDTLRDERDGLKRAVAHRDRAIAKAGTAIRRPGPRSASVTGRDRPRLSRWSAIRGALRGALRAAVRLGGLLRRR